MISWARRKNKRTPLLPAAVIYCKTAGGRITGNWTFFFRCCSVWIPQSIPGAILQYRQFFTHILSIHTYPEPLCYSVWWGHNCISMLVHYQFIFGSSSVCFSAHCTKTEIHSMQCLRILFIRWLNPTFYYSRENNRIMSKWRSFFDVASYSAYFSGVKTKVWKVDCEAETLRGPNICY